MTNAGEDRLECPRCGNRYLPPWRDGDFQCSVCAAALPGGQRGRKLLTGAGNLLPWGLLAVALALLGMGFSRQATARVARAFSPAATLPVVGSPEQQQRVQTAFRAAHQREMLRDPLRSEPHAEIAFDIFADLRGAMEARLATNRPAPQAMGFYAFRERRRHWALSVENAITSQMSGAVTPGLQQAQQALHLAKHATEEISARRALAEGLLLSGEYRRALSQFQWLDALEPGGISSRSYAHCCGHLGLRVPQHVQEALMPLAFYASVDDRAMEMALIERARRTNAVWSARWPRDAMPELRLGDLDFRLAWERAALRNDFPRGGDVSGAERDRFVNRTSGELIRQGIAHYRRAEALSSQPWSRARALSELARGSLYEGHPEAAIALLKRAGSLAPNLPRLPVYLSAAFGRVHRLQGPLAEGGAEASPVGFATPEGMGTGPSFFGIPRIRSSRNPVSAEAMLGEGRRLLRKLEETRDARTAAARTARQNALNRLDELFPGCATRYDPVSDDVLSIDDNWVRRGMDESAQNIEALNNPYPPPGMRFVRQPGSFGLSP